MFSFCQNATIKFDLNSEEDIAQKKLEVNNARKKKSESNYMRPGTQCISVILVDVFKKKIISKTLYSST